MRDRVRRFVLVFGCATGCAVAVAGSAPGAAPLRAAQLVVMTFDSAPGHGSALAVNLRVSPRVPAPARVTLYVPAGYGLRTSAAPGTRVGDSSGQVLTAASPSFPAYVSGGLTVGDPAKFAADPKAQACSPGVHAAVLVVAFTVERQPLEVPIFVDPTSGDEASRGAFRLVACLPSPYVPVGQGGAPAGALLAELGLFLFPGLTTNPRVAGPYTWRMLVTPFVYGTATADVASTFEARSRVLLPHVLTARASYQATTQTLVASGRLLALGRPRAGITVRFYSGQPGKSLFAGGKTKTRAGGRYSMRRRVARKQRARLQIVTFVDDVRGPCSEPPLVAGGCVDETLSAPSAIARTITIPKLPSKKKGRP